jgi:hypothetical protein
MTRHFELTEAMWLRKVRWSERRHPEFRLFEYLNGNLDEKPHEIDAPVVCRTARQSPA